MRPETRHNNARRLLTRYCRHRDQTAFKRFYQDEAGRLWRFFLARGCDEESAYDLVSETFLRFINSICRDPDNPLGLLYRIALNLRIDTLRRAQASPVHCGLDNVDALPDPSASAPTDSLELLKLVQTLYPDEQNLLLMRYWIGMTHKEVAAALELPEGTVRRQTAAAVKRLGTLLDEAN